MAYNDDLLQQAFDLADKNPANPTQADLRRSVSAAYYALFHLLISETIVHWSLDSSRNALGRMFEHSVMKKVSAKISDAKLFPFTGEDPAVVKKLRTVAKEFGRLQDMRKTADYDNATFWSHTDALDEVKTAEIVFSTWQSIRNEKIAQDYLVSLLIKPAIELTASPYFPAVSAFRVHSLIQSINVAYHNSLFCGLPIQWPSSGKSISFDGVFCVCNAVKSCIPCPTGTR